MPRKPRQDFEGAVHHVFGRGNGKQALFLDAVDYVDFEKRLRAVKGPAGCTFLAYCPMPNHYHFAIRTATVRLSKIMQTVLGGYARRFNDRWGRVGHAFQGRFGSRLITSDADLKGVIRYIHRNPVKAGLAESARDWTWSGHQEIVRNSARLLDVQTVWELFGSVQEYDGFVREGTDIAPRPLAEIAGASATVLKSPARDRATTGLRRDFIALAKQEGYRISEIAQYLGKSSSAVCQLLYGFS